MNEEEPPVAFIDLPTSDHPSSSSSSSPTPTPPVSPSPPDGGYGWVVVIAAFFVHIFVLGNIYSFGVLYAEYIDAFDSNKAVMAWVGSIGVCIMGALGAWTGGALVGLGFLIASFSKEVWHLYVTEGVIAGIGYSFAFVAAVSVVGQWFSSRRGVAVGGSVSLIPTVNAELFGIEKLSSIVGTMMTATAVGALLSAPIGGFLYDGTESYFASIALDGTFLFLGFAFTLPVLDSHKNHHHHHHHHHTHDIKDGDHSTDYESLRVDIDLDHPQVNESRNEAKVLLSMEIEENNGIISHSNRSSRSDSSNDNNSDDGVFDEMESVLKEGLDGLVVADRKGHVYEML
eukprot:scaffold233_cov174-Ochromonas_danica.AAC.61